MPRRNINNLQFETTLSAGINDSVTSFGVAAVTDFPAAPFGITVNSEAMEVTDVSGTTLTVARGFDGTTAASHASGDAVKFAVLASDWEGAGLGPDGNIPLPSPYLYSDPDTYGGETRLAFGNYPPYPVDVADGSFNQSNNNFAIGLAIVPQDGDLHGAEYKTPAVIYESAPATDNGMICVFGYRGKWSNESYLPDVGASPIFEEWIDAAGNEGSFLYFEFPSLIPVSKGEPLWLGTGMFNDGGNFFGNRREVLGAYYPVPLYHSRVQTGGANKGLTFSGGSGTYPNYSLPTFPASPSFSGAVPPISVRYAKTGD